MYIHDIAFPAYVKSAAPLQIIVYILYMYIM